MAIPATGQPVLGAGQGNILQDNNFPPLSYSANKPKSPNTYGPLFRPATDNYADTLKVNDHLRKPGIEPIPMKQISYNDGIPRIWWTEEEVDRMNVLENLQYAVVGKFSYGWPELEELRTIIPQQCNIKGECKIGLLRNRHILIRLDQQTDFINLMSKSIYYILAKDGYSYTMRPLIYDAKFKVEEETTQAMAWISFPGLKPTFFVKEALFSLAAAVGKPLQLDSATINKNEKTNEYRMERVQIQYDMLPKYCTQCKVQGHDDEVCRVLHPELRSVKIHNEKETGQGKNGHNNEEQTKDFVPRRRKVTRRYWNPINMTASRENKSDQGGGDQNNPIEGLQSENTFAALVEKKEELQIEEPGDQHINNGTSGQENANHVHHYSSTKEWITHTFSSNHKNGRDEESNHNDNTLEEISDKNSSQLNEGSGEELGINNSQQQQGGSQKDDVDGDKHMAIVPSLAGKYVLSQSIPKLEAVVSAP